MDPATAKLVADNGSGAFDYSNPASYDASAKSITVNKTLTVSTGDAYEEFFVEYKAAPTPPPASTPTITEGNNTATTTIDLKTAGTNKVTASCQSNNGLSDSKEESYTIYV